MIDAELLLEYCPGAILSESCSSCRPHHNRRQRGTQIFRYKRLVALACVKRPSGLAPHKRYTKQRLTSPMSYPRNLRLTFGPLQATRLQGRATLRFSYAQVSLTGVVVGWSCGRDPCDPFRPHLPKTEHCEHRRARESDCTIYFKCIRYKLNLACQFKIKIKITA